LALLRKVNLERSLVLRIRAALQSRLYRGQKILAPFAHLYYLATMILQGAMHPMIQRLVLGGLGQASDIRVLTLFKIELLIRSILILL